MKKSNQKDSFFTRSKQFSRIFPLTCFTFVVFYLPLTSSFFLWFIAENSFPLPQPSSLCIYLSANKFFWGVHTSEKNVHTRGNFRWIFVPISHLFSFRDKACWRINEKFYFGFYQYHKNLLALLLFLFTF